MSFTNACYTLVWSLYVESKAALIQHGYTFISSSWAPSIHHPLINTCKKPTIHTLPTFIRHEESWPPVLINTEHSRCITKTKQKQNQIDYQNLEHVEDKKVQLHMPNPDQPDFFVRDTFFKGNNLKERKLKLPFSKDLSFKE